MHTLQSDMQCNQCGIQSVLSPAWGGRAIIKTIGRYIPRHINRTWPHPHRNEDAKATNHPLTHQHIPYTQPISQQKPPISSRQLPSSTAVDVCRPNHLRPRRTDREDELLESELLEPELLLDDGLRPRRPAPRLGGVPLRRGPRPGLSDGLRSLRRLGGGRRGERDRTGDRLRCGGGDLSLRLGGDRSRSLSSRPLPRPRSRSASRPRSLSSSFLSSLSTPRPLVVLGDTPLSPSLVSTSIGLVPVPLVDTSGACCCCCLLDGGCSLEAACLGDVWPAGSRMNSTLMGLPSI
mmetsp:Transcript_8926/g.25707  ORF Transcript_8926/g.25707 Transcript_8926/m.25707 type:complete len:292 (+) Transcript_8926:525-1400(+)